MQKNKIFLFLVLVLAAFLRFWQLEKIPPGLYPDVAINGTEAFFSLKNFDFKVFYPENYGREGLMIWLIALSFSIFGVSVFSIKLVAAFFGTLTVLGIYLLAKELFFNFKKRETLALLSALFLTTSFWHLNFSRIGFRAILLPFFLCFSFYFLLKAFRKRSIFDAIFSGIFFGLSFYTYTSVRLAVLILPFLFFPFWLFSKKEGWQKRFWEITFVFFTITFFVVLPLGIYFLKHPEHFASRAAPVMVFSAKDPAKEFLKSLISHLLMFNFYGDANWRHNFSKHPQLNPLVGIFFLIGILISAKKILKNFKNLKETFPFWFLFSFFSATLLPGVLTREGIPHALRTIGATIPAFLFSGLGAIFLAEKLKEKFEKNLKFFKILTIFVLILVLFWDPFFYFFLWAKKPQVKSEFAVQFFEIGNYLNSLPEDVEKYVIVNAGGMPVSWFSNLPVSCQTIVFLEISKYQRIRSFYLLPKDIEKIKIKNRGVIVLMQEDKELIEKLRANFPQGKEKKENGFWALSFNL